jgi:transposase
MCDLNAIEIAWAKIKHHIHVNKTADNLSLKAQEENTKVAVDQIMSED